MFFQTRQRKISTQAGFTLMEIVVATTLFAFIATAIMSLFNYVLKINRRTEALRQTTQSARIFVEGFVKQIRNAQIYYGISGQTVDPLHPLNTLACPQAVLDQRYYRDNENFLRILDTEGADTCFYLADANLNYVGPATDSSKFSGANLVIEKRVGSNYIKQQLNPPNVFVDSLVFVVRPYCDPYNYCDSSGLYGAGQYPKTQPMVTLWMKIRSKLSTGEQFTINYQTSISSNSYDIPNQ